MLEGPDLVSAALEHGLALDVLFVASGRREEFADLIQRVAATGVPVCDVDP